MGLRTLILSLGLSGHALAAGLSPVPATSASPTSSAAATPSPSSATKVAPFACKQVAAYLEPANVFLPKTSDGIYYFAETPSKTGVPMTLYKIEWPALKVSTLMSAKLRQRSLFVPLDGAVQGISILAFKKDGADCNYGIAEGLSLAIPKSPKAPAPKPVKNFPPALYRVVPGETTHLVADMNALTVREIDPTSFQQRVAFKFKAGLVPIFVHQPSNQLFLIDAQARVLSRYGSNRTSADDEVKLPPNARLLLDRGSFALATIAPGKNTLEISEDRTWTLTPEDKIYKLTFDPKFMLKDAGFAANFEAHLLAVLGSTQAAQKTMRNASIWNYQTAKQLTTLTAPQGQYVSHVQLAPNGKFAVALLKDLERDQHAGLQVYDVAKNTWTVVKGI